MAARVIYEKEDKEYLNHVCGECSNCEPYMKWETLSVHGRKPTMGTCPNVTDRKVLLSERACKKYNKNKVAL